MCKILGLDFSEDYNDGFKGRLRFVKTYPYLGIYRYLQTDFVSALASDGGWKKCEHSACMCS